MKTIPLTKGYVVLVDDADYLAVSQFKWHASVDARHRTVYARRVVYLSGGVRIQESMHRRIMGVVDRKIQIDHHDRNGLNNQRHNLRVADNTKNQQNVPKRRGFKFLYKGISLPKRGRWIARIRVSGKLLHLGRFNSAEEAARAYDLAAAKHFGEFAALNFPLEVVNDES